MNKIVLISVLFFFQSGILFSQDYDLEFVYPIDSIQYGYGMEAGIKLLNYSGDDGIRFIGRSQDPVQWKFQPDTLFKPGLCMLSLNTGKDYFNGNLTLEIIAIHKSDSVKESLKLNVFGENFESIFDREKKYVSDVIDFIKDEYPEFNYQLEKIDTTRIFCYNPFPAFDIVNHSVMLYNNWRINIQEHVMVPPYNWKKLFLWNDQYNLYFGVQIDTDGECSLVPCELHYYYQNINFSPLEINLSNNVISADNEINELIGTFSTVDNFDTLSYSYKLVNGDYPFSVSKEGELRAIAKLGYEKDTVLIIDILSRNESGYGIVNSFDIKVLKKTIPSGSNKFNCESVHFSVRNGVLYFTRYYDEITVYDLTGKILLTESNAYQINLLDLRNQILIIRIIDDDALYSMKIIL